MGPKVEQSCFLTDVTIQEIVNILNLLHADKAPGDDAITNKILKLAGLSIAYPLCILFNKFFMFSQVPKALKTSKVIPVFKNNSKTDVSNYRPISLLTGISKLFERVIATRMRAFIEQNDILCKEQHGFRTGYSTSSALITLTDNIYKAMNDGYFFASLFIDLSKAFDFIDHDILLKELEHYGFRGKIGKLLESYLMDRTFYTTIGDIKSGVCNIKNGVPQGSVLGPLLFSLFINDLPNALAYCGSIIYADDTTLYNRNAMQQDLIAEMQHDFNTIQMWFKSNYLKVNEAKTKFVIFGTPGKLRQIDASTCNMRINNNIIQRTKEVTYLGVIVDESLTWILHVKYVAKKMSWATTYLVPFKIKKR